MVGAYVALIKLKQKSLNSYLKLKKWDTKRFANASVFDLRANQRTTDRRYPER